MARELTEQEILEIKKEFKKFEIVNSCSVDKINYTRINIEMIRNTSYEARQDIYEKEGEIRNKYPDIDLEFNTFGG